MIDYQLLQPLILELHRLIRRQIIDACEQVSVEELSQVAGHQGGDTIYAIDKISESLLVDFFEEKLAHIYPLVLIAEGLKGGQMVLPRGSHEKDALLRVIVDPIDGTRGLMYQKRSAWILTGIAPNRGADTCLQDIEFAMQSEIPLVKQHLSDCLWAFKGRGAFGHRDNRCTGETSPLVIRPSQARDLMHGFAMFARFVPGGRDILAAVDDELIQRLLGPVQKGQAFCFEDQYISTGGQLYELMMGHDRFVADVRPLLERPLEERGLSLGLCCHPYDICTELIAREAGVAVTDPKGERLQAPLDVFSGISWVGFANLALQKEIMPHFSEVLKKYRLLPRN